MSKSTIGSASSAGLGILLPGHESPEGSTLSSGSSSSARKSPSVTPQHELDSPSGERDLASDNATSFMADTHISKHALSRQLTLLENDKRGKNGPELRVLLGNAQSKLKSGAKLSQPSSPIGTHSVNQPIPLERTASRARVELDIYLESDICVQGGFLKGHIEVRVRKHSKQKYPILLSGGKLRVIGFEAVQNEQERSTFYQCSASLAEVASGAKRLYTSDPDLEGFARTAEGVYLFPFAYRIPLSSEQGTPKGPLLARSGASVRYIVMVSFRIKDSFSGKKSIAHFYRDCSIWPRLDPSSVLAPSAVPIQGGTSPTASGVHKAHLTMTLNRVHWVAGQLCHVQVQVVNNTKKVLKMVTLELFQSMATFKLGLCPGSELQDRVDTDLNACQTTTVNKKIAQSVLSIGQAGSRGHASAKGWWSGVASGETRTFMHSIMIPADALTIQRSKLLEVSYMLQVVVGAGTLLSTDTHVALPLHIINFLSIDPPPSYPPISSSRMKDLPQLSSSESDIHNSATITDLYRASGLDSSAGDRQNGQNDYSPHDSDSITEDSEEELLIQDDDDDFVQHAISSAMPDRTFGREDATRVGDMYHSILQDDQDRAADNFYSRKTTPLRDDLHGAVPEVHHRRSRGFAARVEEKQVIMRERRRTLEASKNPFPKVDPHRDENRGSIKSSGSIHRRAASDLDAPLPASLSGRKMQDTAQNSKAPRISRPFGNRTSSDAADERSLPSADSKMPMKLPVPPKNPLVDYEARANQRLQLDDASDAKRMPDGYETKRIRDVQADGGSRPAAVRSYSVKEKIRELEERTTAVEWSNLG